MKINKDISTPSVNMISNTTRINGDIEINGDFRIDGILNGNIKCSGKLVVGSTSTIHGNIECKNAEISGIILGNVKITELVIFKSTSSITGDIITSKLIVESGAMLISNCDMSIKVSV